MHEQKKIFISFGDSRMKKAAERIEKQAKDFCFFDEIHILNENHLDKEFRLKWNKVLKPEIRGFGYWCWKPYIIRRLLEKIPDGSLVVYCDIGCHLNPQGLNRLKFYISELENAHLSIKAFPACSFDIDVIEKRWTKGDVFDYFGCRENKSITDTQQLASGHILCLKNQGTLNFMKLWESIWEQNFALIDDTASKSRNFPEFIENRHDQSIFSILYKTHGGIALPDKETDSRDFSTMKEFPFWDLRDKGAKDTRFFSRLKRYLYSRIIKYKIRKKRMK